MCSFTTAWRGTPSSSSLDFREDKSAASSRQRNQPGLRTARITAPFSQSALALKVTASFSSVFSSVSSRYSNAAFWGLARNMSVLARSSAEAAAPMPPHQWTTFPCRRNWDPRGKAFLPSRPSQVSQPRNAPHGAPGLPPPPMYDAGWADCQDPPGPKGPQGWPPEAP